MKINGMDVDDAVVERSVRMIGSTLVETEDVLGSMTCGEADTFAVALTALGMRGEAATLLATHALTGDGPEDHSHGALVKVDERGWFSGDEEAASRYIDDLVLAMAGQESDGE